MKRATLCCLLLLTFLTVGYRTDQSVDDPFSKIYLIDETLIRTTPGVDIRLYDISDRSAPRLLSTIPIEGNHDVAVHGDYMYADLWHDLLVVDISDRSKPVLLDTITQTFNRMTFMGEPMPTDRVGGSSGCNGCMEDQPIAVDASSGENFGSRGGGQGGSLARFVIVDNHLYCINDVELIAFDLTDPAQPTRVGQLWASGTIETVFYDGAHLFVGGREGVYIYDISDRATPRMISEFTHARRCDPVVVEGDRAYVTLRGGGPCGGNGDQLDILDISDITKPKLLMSVMMSGPYGLAVKDRMVIVCDGAAGVVLVDTKDLGTVTKRPVITGIVPYDVILRDTLLIVTAESGFYLYDVTDCDKPVLYTRLL